MVNGRDTPRLSDQGLLLPLTACQFDLPAARPDEDLTAADGADLRECFASGRIDDGECFVGPTPFAAQVKRMDVHDIGIVFSRRRIATAG